MSYTELHTGKLKPIQYNMSVEDFKNWLETKEGFKVEDFEEKLEDGTINFTYLFYNGGTCFSEMLEEGLNKVV